MSMLKTFTGTGDAVFQELE